MVDTLGASSRAFSIGRVVNKTAGALQRNAAVIWPVAAILVLIPQGAVQLVQARATTLGVTGLDQGSIFLALFLGLFAGLCSTAFQVAAIYCVVEDMGGRSASIGGALSAAMTRFLPVFAIGILSGIGIALGLVALIVPGLMLAVRWLVAAPVRIAERPGISAALGRSAELTRGSRWSLFGLAVIFWLAALVFMLAVGGVAGLLMVFTHALFIARSVIGLVTAAALAAIYAAFACGLAVIYGELRKLQEGGDAVQTAAVFA